MNQEEINKLAIQALAGNVVFASAVPESLRKMVFMPLMFLDEAQRTEMNRRVEAGEVAELYQHISEAGPRGINGWPIFMSYNMISAADLDALQKRLKVLRTIETWSK